MLIRKPRVTLSFTLVAGMLLLQPFTQPTWANDGSVDTLWNDQQSAVESTAPGAVKRAAAPLCSIDAFKQSSLVTGAAWPGVGPFKGDAPTLIDSNQNKITLSLDKNKVTGAELTVADKPRQLLKLQIATDFLLESVGASHGKISDFNVQLAKAKQELPAASSRTPLTLAAGRYVVSIYPESAHRDQVNFVVRVTGKDMPADALRTATRPAATPVPTEPTTSTTASSRTATAWVTPDANSSSPTSTASRTSIASVTSDNSTARTRSTSTRPAATSASSDITSSTTTATRATVVGADTRGTVAAADTRGTVAGADTRTTVAAADTRTTIAATDTTGADSTTTTTSSTSVASSGTQSAATAPAPSTVSGKRKGRHKGRHNHETSQASIADASAATPATPGDLVPASAGTPAVVPTVSSATTTLPDANPSNAANPDADLPPPSSGNEIAMAVIPSTTAPAASADDLKTEFFNLITKWQQLKRVAVRDRDAATLPEVLGGKALTRQSDAIKWLQSNKKHYDMLAKNVNVDHYNELTKGQRYAVFAQVTEASKYIDDATNQVLKDTVDTYNVNYTVEKVNDHWAITDSAIVTPQPQSAAKPPSNTSR